VNLLLKQHITNKKQNIAVSRLHAVKQISFQVSWVFPQNKLLLVNNLRSNKLSLRVC